MFFYGISGISSFLTYIGSLPFSGVFRQEKSPETKARPEKIQITPRKPGLCKKQVNKNTPQKMFL